jgi:hypothetical protein
MSGHFLLCFETRIQLYLLVRNLSELAATATPNLQNPLGHRRMKSYLDGNQTSCTQLDTFYLSPSTDIRENHQRATVILAHLSTLQCTDHLNNHPHQRSILPSHFSYIDRRVCHPILCLYHSLSLIQFRNVNILSQIFIRRAHDMYHGSTTFTHISQIHS